MQRDMTKGEPYVIDIGLYFIYGRVRPRGFIIRKEAVSNSATADQTECSTGGRLDTYKLSDSISPLLVRGIAHDIDVLYDDVRLVSSRKGTIYLRDLDGRAALRIDLLIEIVLGFRLAYCHRESIFDEELPVLGEVREVPGLVTYFGACCDNVILARKIGYRGK